MLRRPAETVDETVHGGEQFDPTDVVPLSALAAEGFGWDGPFVANPRAAVAALAVRFAGEVVLDDLGRRCVSRPTARGLFAEREAGERRQREALARRDAELAEQAARNPVWTGIPAGWIPDGVSPAAAMMQADKDAQPRRQSVLEHALADRDGAIEYHPIEQP